GSPMGHPSGRKAAIRGTGVRRGRPVAGARRGTGSKARTEGACLMDLLLLLTYAANCVAVYEIGRGPVNQWTVPTTVIGGIFLISALLLIMSYNHPYSGDGRIYFTSAPVIPAVGGIVVEVPVKMNAPLKKGDVLFRIDPRPYQYT